VYFPFEQDDMLHQELLNRRNRLPTAVIHLHIKFAVAPINFMRQHMSIFFFVKKN